LDEVKDKGISFRALTLGGSTGWINDLIIGVAVMITWERRLKRYHFDTISY